MENKKQGPGRKRQDGNKSEKRSGRPPAGNKPHTGKHRDSESRYKKERSTENTPSRRPRRENEQAGEFRKEKPSGSGRGRSYGQHGQEDDTRKRTTGSRYGSAKPPASKSRPVKDDPNAPVRPPRKPRRENEPSDGFRKERSSGYEKRSTSGYHAPREDKRSETSRAGYGGAKSGPAKPRPVKADPGAPLRLNKFIANAGVCSRREADKLIESGAVKVNGVTVTELGTKVTPADKVQLGDQTLSSEKLRYVLLNKPKGYITTTDDPFKRNTVMKLVESACRERIYPVGRLDRNTTGLLLFTNDGELAKRLTHPRFGVRKIYDVELDKPLTKKDMESIAAGVELDGDTIIIDEIAYVELEKNKKHVGIQLHSGQNRVVRRIFEKFGYEVVKLDRVIIGSLTKKDLPRGTCRHLSSLEVRMLKRL